MGTFNLEKQSTSREAEFITGIPKKRLEAIVLHAPGLIVSQHYGHHHYGPLRLHNRELARFIAENAYRNGSPVLSFSQKRRFPPEHHQQWLRWKDSREIS